MSKTDVLARWEGQEFIPLPELARPLGLNMAAQSYAVRKGVITPAPKRGANGRYMVTRDEALFLLAAAGIAAAVGIAIVTALRYLRSSGARVSDGAVIIPLTAPQVPGSIAA